MVCGAAAVLDAGTSSSLLRDIASLQRALAASQAAQQELADRLEAALIEASGKGHVFASYCICMGVSELSC